MNLIFDSSEKFSGTYFRGYAFSGDDFIDGAEGFNDYVSSGKSIEHDADGAYVLCQENDLGELIVSSDYRGYIPIFYYSKDNNWVVGTSLRGVALRVKEKGWIITERISQTESWKSSRALCVQLTSNNTVFNEIRCLESYQFIRIHRERGISIERRVRNISSIDYKDALSRLVSSWSGRINTILNGGYSIRLDLSGGVDSRVILSLLLYALRERGQIDLLNSNRIFVNSSMTMKEDYEVASKIAALYKFPLNNKERRAYTKISGEEGYKSWLNYNLGRYSPNIMPTTAPHNKIITFPGVGGGEHRLVYESFGHGGLVSYLFRFKDVFSDPSYHEEWLSDVIVATDLAAFSEENRNTPMSVRNYRLYRGRHHSSKMPFHETMAVILGSKLFYECTYHATARELEENKILFDVMSACEPTLLTVGYDKEYKHPSKWVLENLCILDKIPSSTVGKTFSNDNVEQPAVSIKTPHANTYLIDDIQRLIVDDGLNLTREDRMKAKRLVEKITSQGVNRNYHSDASFLHYILVKDLIRKVV